MKNALFKSLIFTVVFSLLLSLSVYAKGDVYSWCTPRNGNKQPVFSKEAALVEDNGGFYIDKNHGDSAEEKVLYLTFDAGYENGNVEKILDTMKEKGVTGAFFVLDNLIIKNPDLIRRMKNEGHLICNHTKSHKNLTKCTEEEIKADLLALEEICIKNTGIELDKYFRFPEGKYSIESLKCVNNLGYKTVFWSFGYADWDNNNQPSESYAIKKILSNTHNGAVILLHPTSSTNARILPTLIDAWCAMGYRFGTLDELTEK